MSVLEFAILACVRQTSVQKCNLWHSLIIDTILNCVHCTFMQRYRLRPISNICCMNSCVYYILMRGTNSNTVRNCLLICVHYTFNLPQMCLSVSATTVRCLIYVNEMEA